jgi:membrane-associated phospholipid phosphatase
MKDAMKAFQSALPHRMAPGKRLSAVSLPPGVAAAQASFDAMYPSLQLFLAGHDLTQGINIGADAVVKTGLPPGSTREWRPQAPTGAVLATAIASMWQNDFIGNPSPELAKEIQLQDLDVELWLAMLVGMSPKTHPVSLDLLDAATGAVAYPLHLAKHLLNVPRPVTAAPPGLAPLVPTPGHASYPSGHATVSHAMAKLLADLTGAPTASKDALIEAADRIALNRQVAGLHTAPDTAAGRELGGLLGEWMIEAATVHAIHFPRWATLYAAASKEWV